MLTRLFFCVCHTGICASIALASQWLSNIIVTFAFPIVYDILPEWVPFVIFLGFCIAALVFIWLLLPETKGVPLEKTEALLRERVIHVKLTCWGSNVASTY